MFTSLRQKGHDLELLRLTAEVYFRNDTQKDDVKIKLKRRVKV